MRGARGLVLALAVVAAASAATLVRRAGPDAPPSRADAAGSMVEVLVAVRSIGVGEMVGAADVRWQAWPKGALATGNIQRQPGGSEPGIEPAPARYPIFAGEPIAEAKLARPGHGGILASLVAPGMRAVSVPIREETAVGGFIQPQDRVDVLLTRKSRDGGPAKGGSDVLLKAVKVLAMGKGLDGRGGLAVQNRTATLELTPTQARRLAGAQSAGEISLALVAAVDAVDGERAAQTQVGGEPEQPVATLKFGQRQSERGVN